jgi:hypothetical protein
VYRKLGEMNQILWSFSGVIDKAGENGAGVSTLLRGAVLHPFALRLPWWLLMTLQPRS